MWKIILNSDIKFDKKTLVLKDCKNIYNLVSCLLFSVFDTSCSLSFSTSFYIFLSHLTLLEAYTILSFLFYFRLSVHLFHIMLHNFIFSSFTTIAYTPPYLPPSLPLFLFSISMSNHNFHNSSYFLSLIQQRKQSQLNFSIRRKSHNIYLVLYSTK